MEESLNTSACTGKRKLIVLEMDTKLVIRWETLKYVNDVSMWITGVK